MLLTRNYNRKDNFHRRRKMQKSSFKGISHRSKQTKRHVKLQFWLWRKRQENCILGMFRAKRRVRKNFPFSRPRLSFKTKRNKRITETFGSHVTTSNSCLASRAKEKKVEIGKIKNSLLKPSDCLSDILDYPAVPETFTRAVTDLSQLPHDVKTTPPANSECVRSVVLEPNLKADVVLDKEKNAEDTTMTKITSSHFNVSPKKLTNDVHEFLDGFHRKYGSFIPLEKTDLKNLREKCIDRDKIILEVAKEYMAKLEKNTPSFRVVYKKHTLTLDDLSTLASENWLNDQVINMYGDLIMESAHCKVHFLNSFFHRQLMTKGYEGVKRWTKRVNLFSKCLLLVPVHLEVHWCLVTADLVKKKICLYDSQGNGLQKVARNILRYLLNEAKEKKQSAFESDWTVSSVEEIPQQTNENDCGVFVLEYSRCLALSEPLQFSQSDIPKIRRRIYKELCECKLHEKG